MLHELGRELATVVVVAHLAHHESLGTHARGGHGLVAALAAGRCHKVAAPQAFTWHGQAVALHRKVHVEAAVDDDLLHETQTPFSRPHPSEKARYRPSSCQT